MEGQNSRIALHFLLGALSLVYLVTTFELCSAQISESDSPKLIQFGADMPYTQFLKDHIGEIEQLPFDGIVFKVTHAQPDGSRPAPGDEFFYHAWSSKKYSEKDFEAAVHDLQSADFRRLTQNFARLNVHPGNVDWFADFAPILNNVRILASVARRGRVKGIFFDLEQYGFHLFDYSQQKLRTTKSWEQYCAKVRERGGEVMQAMQNEYPGITVFLSFGLSQLVGESDFVKSNLASYEYGLLVPFLDGMIDAARGDTVIVDGYESTYRLKSEKKFVLARNRLLADANRLLSNPEAYKLRGSIGFGLWMDADWSKRGWHVSDLQKNFFSPIEFFNSVRSALNHTDRYVWIYTERPSWWRHDRPEQIVPAEYVGALWAARAKYDGLR